MYYVGSESPGGNGHFGGHTFACPGLLAVDIFNAIRKGTAAMRPLAAVKVATCFEFQ